MPTPTSEGHSGDDSGLDLDRKGQKDTAKIGRFNRRTGELSRVERGCFGLRLRDFALAVMTKIAPDELQPKRCTDLVEGNGIDIGQHSHFAQESRKPPISNSSSVD